MTGTFHVKVSGKPDIHCRVQGSGPAVTLVHGVGANLDSWDEGAQRMRERFRIIRMDLAGHGKSGRLHGDRTTFAASGIISGSARRILQASRWAVSSRNLSRSRTLPASTGSSSLAPPRDDPPRAKSVDRLALLKTGGIPTVSAAAEKRWFTPEFRQRHPERVARRMRELMANDPVSYAAAYTVFATSDLGDRVGEIRLPTQIAIGEHDVGSNVRMARMMHGAITGSQLHILPGLRHSVLVEAPQQVPTC
jgi:(E)-2-((N-methylformamido)methylene)succinate hydrolase